MARRNKKNAQVVVPAAPLPYVYQCRPVHLDAPVAFVQRITYASAANQAFFNNIDGGHPVVEDKKAKKRRR